MLNKSCFQSVIVGSALLFAPLLTLAGGYVELPRSFGALEIGMSEKDFTRLTGVKPEHCVICIKNETFTTLSQGQLFNLDADGEGADVFFYDGKLYLISISTKSKDLFSINEDFENEFGGPGVNLGTFNDVSKLKWEDQNSVVTLNYHTKNKRVFSVNYYDWDIKQDRDWRESQILEAAKQAAKTVVLDQ